MKKIVLSYFLILSVSLFFSCIGNSESKSKTPQGKAIIEGTFKNAENISSIVIHLPGKTLKKVLLVGGSFLDTISIHNPLNAGILIIDPKTKKYIQTFDIYLEPRSKVSFSADLKDFYNTLKFAGDLKSENDYIFQKRIKSFEVYEYDLPIQNFEDEYQQSMSLLKSPEDFFLEKIDSAQSAFNQLLDSTTLKDSFKKHEKENLRYELLGAYFAFNSLKMSENPDYETPKKILNKFFEVDISNYKDYESYLFFSDVAKFAFVQKKGEILKKANKYNLRLNKSKYLIKEINKINIEELRDDLVEEVYPYLLSESNPEARDSYKELIKNSRISNETLKKKIQKRYKKIKDFIPGNIAYNFTAVSKNGYIKKLSNYKGTPVLLQIWAAWHKASIKELLYMKLLQQNIKSSSYPLKVISVSIDKNKDSSEWIKTINRLALPGTHLRIQDNEINRFLENYNISDKLPKYILIDKTGTISQSDLPFPSADPNFKDLMIFDADRQQKQAREKAKKIFKN